MFDSDKGLSYSTGQVYEEGEVSIDLNAAHNRENFDKAFVAYAYEYFYNKEYRTDLVVLLKSLMYFAKSNEDTNLETYRYDWIKILENVKASKYEIDYETVVLKFVEKYFNKKGYDFINKKFFESYYRVYQSNTHSIKDILKGCVPFYKDKYIPTKNVSSVEKIKNYLKIAGSRRLQKRKSKRKSTKRRTKRKLRRKNTKK
jgi:hypothetical protein